MAGQESNLHLALRLSGSVHLSYRTGPGVLPHDRGKLLSLRISCSIAALSWRNLFDFSAMTEGAKNEWNRKLLQLSLWKFFLHGIVCFVESRDRIFITMTIFLKAETSTQFALNATMPRAAF